MTWLVESIVESDEIHKLLTDNIVKTIKTSMKPVKK